MTQQPDADLCLHDVLDEQSRSRPAEAAVVEGDTQLDYSQFGDRVRRLATLLVGHNVGAGDRVAWVGQNSFRILELMFAAGRIGAIVCPVNWRQSSAELAFVLADLNPALVVEDTSETESALDELRTSLTSTNWLRADNSPDGYEAALARCQPDLVTRQCDPASPLLILYTAAHEGRPNGALLTHRGLIAAGVMHGVVNGVFDERPVFLAALPMYHIATLIGCLSTFLLGGTNVYLPRPSAADICRHIESDRCTWAYLTGPLIGQVAEEAELLGADFGSFRTPAAYITADARWSRLGNRSNSLWSRLPGSYGQTEMTGIVTYTALAAGAAGAAGRPSPWCLVRIVDVDDQELPSGETGEIAVRGATVGAGYWNRPELNERRSLGGWWHTGDLGRREADGSLTFVGPKLRMVKSGKENIYPVEVERCLREHPLIADAGVIGVPDQEWEQSVKAIVVLVPGASLSSDEVISHCRDRIASYKKPKIVAFVDELPRANGQLDRDKLDEIYGGGGYPGVGA